jgi:hypothetical protein
MNRSSLSQIHPPRLPLIVVQLTPEELSIGMSTIHRMNQINRVGVEAKNRESISSISLSFRPRKEVNLILFSIDVEVWCVGIPSASDRIHDGFLLI